LWERIRTRSFDLRAAGAAMVMIIGGLVCVAQLWPRAGRQQVFNIVSIDTLWYALASMFFPDARISDAVGPAIIVLAFITYGISRRALPAVFLWTTLAALMLVFVFIWMGGLRHAGLLLVVTLAAVWIADAYGAYRRERLLMAALAVSLVYSIWTAADAWIDETRYAFSGSREVAGFMRRNHLDRMQLVAHGMFWNAPLVYLPGVQVWYPVAGRYGTYSRWERAEYTQSLVPVEDALARVPSQLHGKPWLLIANRELPQPLRSHFRLLFETHASIWRMRDERYWLYVPEPPGPR
ncbi:MAG: hypothetical protein M3Q69_07150, partial [Acidobacteriota bacterium]|nr:hypothetical protein [Acidobacteriota bacterium]